MTRHYVKFCPLNCGAARDCHEETGDGSRRLLRPCAAGSQALAMLMHDIMLVPFTVAQAN